MILVQFPFFLQLSFITLAKIPSALYDTLSHPPLPLSCVDHFVVVWLPVHMPAYLGVHRQDESIYLCTHDIHKALPFGYVAPVMSVRPPFSKT